MEQVYDNLVHLINLINGEYIPSVNVLSEAKKEKKVIPPVKPTYFKSYFTTEQFYDVNETQIPKLSLVSGFIDFYIVNDLHLQEYCNCIPIEHEKQLQSIKIIIDKNNINDYIQSEEDSISININHNFNALYIDCSIHFYDGNTSYRVLTPWAYINQNSIKICLPKYIDLSENQNYKYEIIIYNVGELSSGEQNIFSYFIPNPPISSHKNVFTHNFNSNIVDIIKLYIYDYDKLIDENTIEYTTAMGNAHSYVIYTCEKSIRIPITNARKNQVININHNLNGDVNVILRDSNGIRFYYNDIKVDNNNIQIAIPDSEEIISNFTVDCYLIYKE